MRDGGDLGGFLGGPARGPSIRLRSSVTLLDLSPTRRRGLTRARASRVGHLGGKATLALLGLIALLAAVAALRARGEHAHAPAAVIPAAQSTGPRSESVVGEATFYAGAFQGQTMADGATFNMDDPTIAAANRWPLGEKLCVRRVAGGPWDATLTPQQRSVYFGRAIEVTVSDRGAFTHALDLSRGAFAELGRLDEGVIRVAITPAPDQTSSAGCGEAPSL